MESCFGKSVMSGVMGFGMGGLFGMFMASVRSVSNLQQLSQANISLPDVLRYTVPHSRSRQPAKHDHIAPSQATTQNRIQGYGNTIMVYGQELRQSGGLVLWRRVRYRGFASEERSHKQCRRRMFDGWYSGQERWSSSRCRWLFGLRSLQCCY
jgi:hypothetical protein